MINANSRYANNAVATVDVNGKSRQVIVSSSPEVTSFTYVAHIYASDETIDGLAYTYFGDPTQWWQIANVNPEIMDWSAITPGTVIRIPTI